MADDLAAPHRSITMIEFSPFGQLAFLIIVHFAFPSTHGNILTKRIDFTSQGCYSEVSAGGRALDLKSYADDSMTIESCAAFCSDFKYFGTEYGRECYCGNAISTSNSTDCTLPCAGDATETCGNGGKLNVYLNNNYVSPSVAHVNLFAYKGCHSEGSGVRALGDKLYTDDNMTPQKCATACAGYDYAGIEYGDECWCGGEIAGGSYVSDADCSFLCPGDKRYFCGAGNRLTIYAAVKPANVTGFEYQGCFADDVNDRVLKSRQFADDAMTAEMCAANCAQYAYFGVEYGKECFCGTSFNSTAPVADSECAMSCPGNGGEVCGDANRVTVYGSKTTGTPPANMHTVGNYAYIFCSSDDGAARVLADRRYGDDNLTVEKCAGLCDDYSYFGVEYALECYCGDEFTGAQEPESDCNYLCGGSATEFCGAANRINVYGPSVNATLR
ncbi:WSC domain-containing protein [Xylariales sp. AK1849]|nr:WSC domain-containing protein [Xylariales sp. AK1849]